MDIIYCKDKILERKGELQKLFGCELLFTKSDNRSSVINGNAPALLLVSELNYPEHCSGSIACVVNVEDVKICVIGDTSTIPQTVIEADIRQNLGNVYLVGAGQSAKELLTLRAHSLIASADIIFYDSLIDKKILEHTKAELVFVGKRAGAHHVDQKDINSLLKESATKYKSIVRIKGGDPMIFGHAGEEIAYLEQEFISVEVVPGITSALGAAASTSTPLTLRNVSASVAFCTAHQKSQIPVPETDTIVYFMGAGNVVNLAKTLLNKGKSPDTPLKLIYNIGAPDEEVFLETVHSIIQSEKTYKSPLLIIVGEVTDKKNWYKAFEHRPKILFTGTNITKYAKLGYVHHHPMIALKPLSDPQEVDHVIDNINNYNWLVFTSIYAAKFFFAHLFKLGKDVRVLSGLKIASIGRFTSKKIKEFGIVPDLQATDESSEGLIACFKMEGISGEKIVIPRSNLAHNTLPDGLQNLGNEVLPLIVYQNVKTNIKKRVNPESFDQIIFTSPSCVQNFIKEYGELPQIPKIISKGKETAKEIAKYR